MTKTELVKAMAEQTGLTQKVSSEALEAIMTSVGAALKAGDDVKLVGFGTFQAKETPARNGVNPITKEPIVVPAHKRISFKPSKVLKESMNA